MVVLGLGTFVLVLVSYTHIIMTALGIDSASGQNKIFSTCSSHVLVVTIFYGSGIFRYMTPASGSALEQVLSMQYIVVTLLLNPLIYSLKNQEKEILSQQFVKGLILYIFLSHFTSPPYPIDYCPELERVDKVQDSSFWLSPGASSICAVQCGDPATESPYLQSEEPGGEGSSKEDAGQEA
ncbi:hypothetical protein MG293_003074 [Ovis ammon polii]|uniref:Uncharacterized protein n=1 Tax=Ovis ammon polii TaxID=230172 RepID=A0AAD4YFV0_OVIAM|nr:hypothetical protein MG293_003074 [Ovis ammon polii]